MKSKNALYILIGVIVILGAIVPYAAEFVLPILYPNAKIAGAAIWNQFVSIILGIVATITSIVSLVLGFRSENESKETELRTRDLLKDIEMKVQLMSQKQDQMQHQIQSSLIKDYNESKNSVSVNLASGKSNANDEIIN